MLAAVKIVTVRVIDLSSSYCFLENFGFRFQGSYGPGTASEPECDKYSNLIVNLNAYAPMLRLIYKVVKETPMKI